MANDLISVNDCPCDGCSAKPCGHPAKCVEFALWLNKTVDATEVVRCKECWFHGGSVFAGKGNVFCKMLNSYFPENGFCSKGERRDDHAAD